jgi:uncharacterized repeat protein (TIGR01451 family)
MKKLILILITFCLQFNAAKAQWVAIPDVNFLNIISLNYPGCVNGNQMDTICVQNFLNNGYDILDCSIGSTGSISNLSGVQYLNGLEWLMCNNNVLTTLPPLPNSIVNLDCSYNELTTLPQLPNTLRILTCVSNQLTSLPSLPDSLITLECAYNQLTYIPPVPSVMSTFTIPFNNISCVSILPEVTSFGYISDNPLTCVPNQTAYSLGLPLCIDNDQINNPNNCISTVNISGHIFTDQDTNCYYNNNDLGTSNVPVKLFDSQNNLLAQSYSINGIYGFSANQTGNFQVKIEGNNLPFAMACAQVDSQMVNVISLTNTITNVNFPVQCNENLDLNIQSVTAQGWVFPGQTHILRTNISSNENWYNLNCGSSVFSGTVIINIAGPITYLSPANNALTPQVNGNTFSYYISNFQSLTPNSFDLNLITDTTVQVSTPICVNVIISPSPLDANTTNNVYDFCYNVLNSYDPNLKEVYPVNVLPGYNDWLTYTIHFQNTGNAPAFNIRLIDTLDTKLDLNTFQILGFSHDAVKSISNNVLTVRFNNIMLQDSITNYEGSMGFFQYRIKPKVNQPLGAKIYNTAYIYFDFNAPIITNTTQNIFEITGIIVYESSIINEFILYPNPSNSLFNFKETKNLKQVEVYNLLGEQILAQGNQKQINLSGFAKGIYYARINGEVVVKLLKE